MRQWSELDLDATSVSFFIITTSLLQMYYKSTNNLI